MTPPPTLPMFGIRSLALRGVAVAIPAVLGGYVIATPAMTGPHARLVAAMACGVALLTTAPLLWRFVVQRRALLRQSRYGTCDCTWCRARRGQRGQRGAEVDEPEVPPFIVGDRRDVGPNPRYWH